MSIHMRESDIPSIEGWSAENAAAQERNCYLIGGKARQRIRYGEGGDAKAADFHPCRDCGALKDQFHVPGCEFEVCPACKGSVLTCTCDYGH